jgi:hypothetical protein
MHSYDPHGAIREYRRQRDRRECYRSILFGVGFVCALVIAACGTVIVLGLAGR